MITHEGLDRYVRRILKEKNLTLSDVERRADSNISDSYVHGISTGSIKNLSVDKLKALARGLGVRESQLFAACGVSLPDLEEFVDSEFACLFYKYRELSKTGKQQLSSFLKVLDREIDRLLLENTPIGEVLPDLPAYGAGTGRVSSERSKTTGSNLPSAIGLGQSRSSRRSS